MKPTAVLICILLLALLAAPIVAAGAEPDVTQEIITGVTLEPTKEPTTEIIVPPTSLHTVTETPETPVTTRTEKEITTTEPPEPQVGWLTILSTPSEAEVTVDGRPAGVTPITGRELGAGTHAIRITIAGYEPFETGKEISAGEQAAVDATLTPVPVTTVPTTRATTPVTEVPTISPPAPCLGCDKGWIRVNCNVNGATVSFDDLSSGCTITGGSCDTEVGTTSTPFRTFTVQKPGYQIFTGSVISWPAKGETVNLYATLNPEPTPSYGNIQVISHPSGAVVTLDGGSWQYTPATFTSVSSGTSHYLQITMSGYQQYGTSAFVTAGQTSSVNAYLVPNTPYPKTGSLNIVTSPKGADIYVDGDYIAESPNVVTDLAPGSHTLRLHKAGYDEYFSFVTIVSGRKTPLTYTFTPQQMTVGSIEVASTPAGSSLYLDGNYMGQTPSGSYFDLTSIIPGYHTILIRLTDYRDYTQTVYVKGGLVVTVNAQLTPNGPSPTPDTTGEILVVSTPAGAELFLDNAFRGITPVTLTDIPAGSHVMTARQAGYTNAQETVTVIGGQSTPVALTLTEIPVTTRTSLSVVPILGAVAMTGTILALGRRKK
ncbi:MAG: PEGA domain-containing protein [Methanoregula sp.]